MSRRGIALVSLVMATAVTSVSLRATGPEEAKQVTFYKDVLPILQNNCQTCHRPGEIAPMSFMSYKEVRPWAKAIKQAVVSRQMPPWFAEANHVEYTNDRRLDDASIKTLAAWVDGGVMEGNAKDAPPPAQFVDGWGIKPDMIIEMPKDIELPATGTINYKNILVKVNFPEDRWVIAADLRPSNRESVHHMRANVRPPDSEFMRNAEPGVAYEQGDPNMGSQDEGIDLLGKYNPGLGAQDFGKYGSAKFVPKGSDIIFNMHYTATGKPATDRSKLALVFAKNPPKLRYFVNEGPTASNLAIPAGEGNAEVVSEMTAQFDTQLVYMQPHMHLRGKDYEVRLIFPDGRTDTVFKTKFDFNWQLGVDLEKPIFIPKGTRIVGIAHFDNSANNKWNPDPAKLVVWGPQNWDEMQNCFMGFLVAPEFKEVKSLFKRSGPSLLPRGTSGPTLSTLLIR